MISTQFAYTSPQDVQEAIETYQQYDGDAFYLSGGTDLLPRVKLGLEKPRAVIDLKRIGGLKAVEDRGEWIKIGSLVTIFDLREDGLISEYFPAFKASLEATSCESLQMRATVGGNLLQNTRCLFYNQSEFWRKSKGFCFKMGGDECNAVPGAKKCFANYCSDNATALSALSSQVELIGPGGERRVDLDEIYSGKPERPFSIQPGEILTAIFIPRKKTVGDYEKLRLRGAIDYPLLNLAIAYGEGGGKLVVGAIGPKPYGTELNQLSHEAINEAVQAVSHYAKPVANTVLDPHYRKRMILTLAKTVFARFTEGE